VQPLCGTHWLPTAVIRAPFPERTCDFHRLPSAERSHARFHPLVGSTPLQSPSVSDLRGASRHLASMAIDALHLPWGWQFPSSRHEPASSIQRVFQARRLSVLGVSHALDGLLRHRSRGFVSPHCHVQGSLFRGFPSRPAVPLFSGTCPLVVGGETAAGNCSGCQRHGSQRRPQGLDPSESPLLEERG